MATPAAVLSILVDANTHEATTALSKFETKLKGVDKTSVSATARTSILGTASRKTGSYLASAAKYAAGAAAAYISIGEAKQAIETTQDLAKVTAGLNRNLGFSVKKASEWGAVAKSRDIDTKTLTMSFTTLSRQLVTAATALKAGGSAADTAYAPFQRLGLSQQDVIDGSKNLSAFMPKLADAFGNASGGAERQASAQQLLGRGYQTILPLFSQGAKGLEEQQKWADKYGATLTGKTLKGQMDLIQSERETKVAVLGLQTSFTKFLTPALEIADEKFRRIAAIVGSDKLTPEEKFKKIGDIVGKWADEAYNAFIKILPKIISAAGDHAPKIANAFVQGFLQADVWGKLAVGGWLFAKFGGFSAFSGLGKKAGSTTGKGFVAGMLLALPLLIPEAAKLGDQLGHAIRKHLFGGESIQEWIANEGSGSMADALKSVVDSATNAKEAAAKASNLFDFSPNEKAIAISEKFNITMQRAKDLLAKAGKQAVDFQLNIDSVTAPLDRATKAAGSLGDSSAKNLGRAGDSARGTSKDFKGMSADGITSVTVLGRRVSDFSDAAREELAASGNATDKFRAKASHNFGLTGNSIHALDSATGSGLQNIGDNLNSILKGMKVGEVKFSIKQAAKSGLNAINSVVGRQGGGMVPGTGSGDKVPLHIGGQLAAMVEPGEYVSVANRNATAALMQANAAVPRFADGGVVPAVSEAIKLVTGKFPGLSVTSTTGGTHAPGSYHYQGKAVDLANGDTGYMDKAAAWIKTAIGKYLLEGIHNPNLSISNGQTVSPSFWGASTWADHIDHIHLALDSLGRVMGAASKIKQQILSGPAGPLTDLGQSILDRARTAGDNFIAKHSPGVGDTGMGVTLYKGPLDKTFPSFSVTQGFGGQPQLSPDQVRGLASKAGLPGDTFEKIAHGESNYFPGVISTDGGYGLWQMTPRVQSAETVNAWHKIGSYFNPWRNALMAKYLYDRASSKTPNTPGFPWYGTRYLQKGGLVPHLKGGSKKPKDTFSPHIVGPPQGFTVKPGALVPENIDKLFDRISKVKHRIAKLTESISIFDQFAQVDGIFTDAERNTEIDQNVRLLKMQREIVALATKGENTLAGPIKHAKGNAGSKLKRLRNRFHGDITQMTGLTGKSGDIAQTQLTLYGLLHPDSSSTNASDLAALQLAIANDTIKRLSVQVAQGPVFSQFFAGAFKNGGSIPAGKWGLVGEAGPEIVSGPAQVTSSAATQQVLSPAAPHIENHIYIDPVSLETRVETYVDGKLNKEGRNMLNRLPAGGPLR